MITKQFYFMSKKELDSTLQKNFLTQSTFKRNTRYFDVPSIMNLQNQHSIKRRKPIQSPTNSQKLQSSFTNSTTALTSKLNDDVDKYKNRMSVIENKSNYEREYSSPGSPKLKSFSIEKVTGRQYHHRLKNKAIQDERLFNNFKIQKPDLSKTSDFGKLRSRKFDFELKHMNDLYHESQKPFQKFYYPTTSMSQKVNYKKENKNQKRYFFRSRRKEDFPATILDPEKVDSGLKIASNFKGSNLKNSGITSFYLETGRQYPSSLDMRFNNTLTNFRKNQEDKLIKPDLDFTIRKMKEELISQRKQIIKNSKKPNFTRDQLCDQKYFKAHTKQNGLK